MELDVPQTTFAHVNLPHGTDSILRLLSLLASFRSIHYFKLDAQSWNQAIARPEILAD
jgi:hypothetical protein